MMDDKDYVSSVIAQSKGEASYTVVFEHEAGMSMPALGKQHITIRHTKVWAKWPFSLAKLFHVDLGRIDCLYDTIDCGEVMYTSVVVSFDHGETIVTAEYKGKVEGE
jgi:hypothetical protein